jgi:hypothetical protein
MGLTRLGVHCDIIVIVIKIFMSFCMFAGLNPVHWGPNGKQHSKGNTLLKMALEPWFLSLLLPTFRVGIAWLWF